MSDRRRNDAGFTPNDWNQARLPFDNRFATMWRQLFSSQVAFVREFWEVAGRARVDPPSWPAQATDFWSRWASPAAWLSSTEGKTSRSNQPVGIYFKIDGFAEASAEQRALLSSPAPIAVSRVTPLKNVLARGEIEATHVDARIAKTTGPGRLTVTLLDLARVQQSLRERVIDPGLYVGAVLGDKDETRPPIAIVQVLLTGD